MINKDYLDSYKNIKFFYDNGVLFNSAIWPPQVKDLHEMAKKDGIQSAEEMYNHFHIDDITEEVDPMINAAEQRCAAIEICNFWRKKIDEEHGPKKIAIEIRDFWYSCYLVAYTLSSIDQETSEKCKIQFDEIENIKFHPEVGITLNDQLFKWLDRRITFDMNMFAAEISKQHECAVKLWMSLRKVVNELFPNLEIEIDLCDFCDKIVLRVIELRVKER